jgi:hypothetical protein
MAVRPRMNDATAAKGFDPVTCAECGATTRRSHRCRRCGAPVVEHAVDRAPRIRKVGHQGEHRSGTFQQAEVPEAAVPVPSAPGGPHFGIRIVVGFLNFAALWFLIAFTGTFLTRGRWDNSGANPYGYPPPWACLVGAISCGTVPVLTVAIIVRKRIRNARERQAMDSEPPLQLPPAPD